jgi:ABC-2 type transport system ATP-binding protein
LACEHGAVPVIETERLTKSYGSARGIEDVTITVEVGEVFGFLGPNGAGKTTTIRTLLDLLHPTSGSARIFGLDSRRESVAIRAGSATCLGTSATGRGPRAAKHSRYWRDFAGWRAWAGRRRWRSASEPTSTVLLGEFSRGNRQKVGLILATFHEPELLILDEPTSGLDPLMQEEIEDGIEPLAFFGVTVAALFFAALGAWLFECRDLSG